MSQTIHGVFTSTAAAVGEVPGTSAVASIVFVISGLGAETIALTGRIRTTTYTAALRPINLNTGAVAAASALTNGEYQLINCNFEALKFTKSATSDNVTISYRCD